MGRQSCHSLANDAPRFRRSFSAAGGAANDLGEGDRDYRSPDRCGRQIAGGQGRERRDKIRCRRLSAQGSRKPPPPGSPLSSANSTRVDAIFVLRTLPSRSFPTGVPPMNRVAAFLTVTLLATAAQAAEY